MEEQLYTAQEVADMLKLKKTTVYDMIKKGTLGAVRMGKSFRIPESEFRYYFAGRDLQRGAPLTAGSPAAAGEMSADASAKGLPQYIVCGQDMILDMLCSKANSVLGENRFLRSYTGSFDGIGALYNRKAAIATAHLWDKDTDTYNLPFIRILMPGERVSVYHVMKRPVCIYTAAGNPKKITSVRDFSRKDISAVSRERGSGIRVLVDSLLSQNGIEPEDVKGYGRIVHSHLAAASAVSRGEADCAVGTKNAALSFPNVGCVFLKNENYDLILRKSDENKPEIRLFLDILTSGEFRGDAESMGGYDVADMGKKIL